MRVNMDKLRGLMKEHHVTIADLCETLGMNPSTFYRKANTTNGESFTIDYRVVSILHIKMSPFRQKETPTVQVSVVPSSPILFYFFGRWISPTGISRSSFFI